MIGGDVFTGVVFITVGIGVTGTVVGVGVAGGGVGVAGGGVGVAGGGVTTGIFITADADDTVLPKVP